MINWETVKPLERFLMTTMIITDEVISCLDSPLQSCGSRSRQ